MWEGSWPRFFFSFFFKLLLLLLLLLLYFDINFFGNYLPKKLAKLVEFTQCWWNKEWFVVCATLLHFCWTFQVLEKVFNTGSHSSQVRNNENNGQLFFLKKTFGGRLLTSTILKLLINNYFLLIISQMLLWGRFKQHVSWVNWKKILKKLF